MNKEELLNSLARKHKVTKEATQLEKSLSKSLAVKQQAKKSWNVPIIVLSLVGIYAGGLQGYDVGMILLGIAIILGILKYRKMKESSKKVEILEKQLELEMSKPEYQAEIQNFPIKFYDSYSINRLYQLINEERATTLQEAFNLLENQLNAEYQINLAEQNLVSVQATERSARVTAVSSTISAFNTSKK
ncbi:hypothetical protein [Vagococcus silagei]|uniref:Uncharacterized protein n=1 Tax=Vagococcus silagei TaxID=2508885 RepID=A0A4S3B8W9_9ENTE|nr:hypothetical protein [Vagococcus silagei]THB61415.1 hypothetical protein ESZ54_05055 [Vagococcus silagei]